MIHRSVLAETMEILKLAAMGNHLAENLRNNILMIHRRFIEAYRDHPSDLDGVDSIDVFT